MTLGRCQLKFLIIFDVSLHPNKSTFTVRFKSANFTAVSGRLSIEKLCQFDLSLYRSCTSNQPVF
jgi:hypothetical protein